MTLTNTFTFPAFIAIAMAAGTARAQDVSSVADVWRKTYGDLCKSNCYHYRCICRTSVNDIDVARDEKVFTDFEKVGIEIYRLDNSVRSDFIIGADFARLRSEGWTSVLFREAAYVVQYAGEDYAVYRPSADPALRFKEGLPYVDPLADVLGVGVLTSAWRVGDGSSHPFEVAEALASGKYQVTESDESRMTLVASDIDELVLDRTHGYAVLERRWHWDAGKPIKCIIRNGNWSQFSNGAWFPAASTLHYFDRLGASEQPFLVAEISFTPMEPCVESDFDLVADQPGWTVRVGGAKDLEIGTLEKGESIKLSDVASGDITFMSAEREYSTGAIRIVIWINLGLILCVALFELWRRRQKSTKNSAGG